MREIKHLSVHQWLRSATRDSQQPTSPIGFLFLKLPPPPCAVLLVLLLQSLHKALSSTILYYKACTRHVPVLLCTTKLAQSTSQYYFVLQSVHKAFPSTTLSYKACTKHVPVLLCAQSTFQYYFALQSLHKARPSTTLYVKACTKHFPILLCTTKLAKRTSQYYLVLQNLHKARPSTTLHYKARKKNVPVLPCTTNLAQSTSQYYFVHSLQCVLPHYVANPHVPTHMATPLHCDLQAEIQQTHRSTHTWTTTRPEQKRRTDRTDSTSKRPQPHPPHSRRTLRRCLQPLCKEKHNVSCSGFPIRVPCNIHAAITVHFAESRGSPASLYAHGNKTWQQSCSHYTAICNQRFNKRIEPHVAEQQGRTDSTSKQPQPHPPHSRGTFDCRLQPLCKEKHKGSCSGFLPNTSPVQHLCSHYNALCSITWLTRISLPTWQQNLTTIMQPEHCDLQPEIQQAHRNTHTWTTTRCRTPREPIRPRNDPSRTRPTHEVPFIAACSHFVRKSTMFPAPASSPKQVPCNIHAPTTMRFAASRGQLACHYAHMQNVTTIMQPTSQSPLPFPRTTSLGRHFPCSPLPLVTTSLGHHFLGHHFPKSPLP